MVNISKEKEAAVAAAYVKWRDEVLADPQHEQQISLKYGLMLLRMGVY